MLRIVAVVFATLTLLCGCAGTTNAPSAVVLSQTVAYIGQGQCVVAFCLRGPGVPGTYITVAQNGNASEFSVTSADPTIATGKLGMLGPGGVGDPVIELMGVKAGSTTLTITGAKNKSASLPITVTTISTFTLTLNGLPTANGIQFKVQAPANAGCLDFESGYTLGLALPTNSGTIVFGNFPAMGAGPAPGCVFSTVEIVIYGPANAVLADKTVQLSIAIGQDNPQTVTVP